MSIRKFATAVAFFAVSSSANAALIVETFESFSRGTIITNQLTGLTVTALNAGNANIATASVPVVPGQPQGIYNDAPGVFPSGFEFPLVFDFVGVGSSIGAILDFGVIGAGVQLIAYDGVGGAGNILGSISATARRQFIGINAAGIKSAIFQNVNALSPASWMLDNLTYNAGVGGRVPAPATLALLGLGFAGIGYQRRKQKQIKAA